MLGTTACSPQIVAPAPPGGAQSNNEEVTISAISLSPAAITLPKNSGYTYAFSGTGGVPPYEFTVLSGPGQVASNGVFTVGAQGNTQIKITDSRGNTAISTINSIPYLADGAIRAAVTDGTSLFIGGEFTAIHPYPAPKMAAINATTGNPDLAFDLQSGFNGQVKAIVTSGNFAYVGGLFTTYRGIAANYLAKVDLSSGELDTTFTQATGFDANVNALAIQGGALYVGGYFSQYRGSTASSLAKLDLVSGDLDSTFTQGTGIDNEVYALAVNDDALYAGGWFSTYRGASANNIAKIDLVSGALDTTFTQGAGFDYYVSALAIQGGALYAGGAFGEYQGTPAESIAKLDLTTGALDTTFTNPTAFDNSVEALAVNESAIYVGGSFSNYRGVAAPFLAKLNLVSGDLDTTFTQATGFSAKIGALALDETGLYAGGRFLTYRGVPANGIAKLGLSSGILNTTFTQTVGFSDPTKTNVSVTALNLKGNTVYAGGIFSTYRGTPASYIAKFDLASGLLDQTFTQTAGFSNFVQGLALDGTSLYAGGQFTTYRGLPANYLAKLNSSSGNLDTAFSQATGFSGQVFAVAADASGVYVGGSFTLYRGAAAARLAKLNLATGDLNTTFTQATGINANYVNALALNDSALYVGGKFTAYRGTAALNIAKVDLVTGDLDPAFTGGSGFNTTVNALALNETDLYAGGAFISYKGAPAYRISKVDLASGILDTTFTQAAAGAGGTVNTVTLDGNDLYIGGIFTTYRNAPAVRLAKLNSASGALDAGFVTGTGFNGAVNSTLKVESYLFVGGAFSTYKDLLTPDISILDPLTGDSVEW
ncbi:MAG: hypothetical protein A2070_11590 [Bdellovibrionales bacterium GWC1_52_8]|nr:MAG: hypothetical protein A2Z97_07555 [Bdellovibrionales bacterium GWB1_52_6]OFZ04736.1 MAG: hypothetical protein A2X97_13500 [Bdellovibrionales bacterium GWA1_52_35]OFZ36119.1 MAG: hypothetical protein A2070_11590 [Bdellovibrionales bacterium GWC1_52_8]